MFCLGTSHSAKARGPRKGGAPGWPSRAGAALPKAKGGCNLTLALTLAFVLGGSAAGLAVPPGVPGVGKVWGRARGVLCSSPNVGYYWALPYYCALVLP